MEFRTEISLLPICYLIQVFDYDFITNFAHRISDAASDCVTYYVMHGLLNTNLWYYCAFYTLKFDEKSSLIVGFNTISLIIWQ